MPERFGDALRSTRQKAKRSLGDVARLLDVSVVYVSDVERGTGGRSTMSVSSRSRHYSRQIQHH